VNKDEQEAVKWYRKAADQGYAWGQLNMGRCYLYGIGVTRSESKGREWLGKASSSNDEAVKKAVKEFLKG
jgi:TPR repeat protein